MKRENGLAAFAASRRIESARLLFEKTTELFDDTEDLTMTVTWRSREQSRFRNDLDDVVGMWPFTERRERAVEHFGKRLAERHGKRGCDGTMGGVGNGHRKPPWVSESYAKILCMSNDSFGLVQVFTGNGKGKTTAALGTALRAAAIGKRVAWIAFDKGGESHYSERALIRDRIPEIQFFVTGLDRIDPITKRFRFGVTDDDRREGERGLAMVGDLFARNAHDLVVLDEINSTTALGIISETAVLALILTKPPCTELILTGRNAPASFRDHADLVTEMTLVKHYFYRGIKAREGLDY